MPCASGALIDHLVALWQGRQPQLRCRVGGRRKRAEKHLRARRGTRHGRTEQNRKNNSSRTGKTYKKNKALSAEQAADFGKWQQSGAAPAGRRQIHAIMESTSRSYFYQSPWQGTANLQLVRTHMCTPTVGENDEKYDHFKVTLTYKRPAEK